MALVNSTNASKAEISIFFNTLSGLVKSLENRFTTVDLRNECCITGKIVKVDAHMNIEMEDAVFYDMRGRERNLSNFYVSARNIRHIHMPKNADAMQLLRSQFDCMTRKSEKPKRRTFKVSRAEQKNRETIREAYQSQNVDEIIEIS